LSVRSREIYETQLGATHPDVAMSLNNLAELYRFQGRYGETEPLYGRSIAILLEKLGENHPSTQTVQNNFLIFLQQVIQEQRTDELSDDPMTQAELRKLRKEE
jgi:hypothetical protein